MPETLLFADCETTGEPAWKEPSDAPHQPHIVQLAAQLVDESGEIINTMDRIVKPDGWTIPEETVAIHGITTEKAMDLGIPEPEVLDEFHDQFWSEATKRLIFNDNFDARILRIAMKRFRPAWCEDWKRFPRQCVMQMAKPHCKMPPTEKMLNAGFKSFKPPKLEEAAQILLGIEMGDKAHDALADVEHTVAVYFEIKRREAEAAAEGEQFRLGERTA